MREPIWDCSFAQLVSVAGLALDIERAEVIASGKEKPGACHREGVPMPVVPITSLEQYEKATEVLDRVGGTFQGVGQKEWFLIVTEAQYKALVEAGVVAPQDSGKDSKGGKNSRARQILRDALEQYRRPDGYEGCLVEAAWQLEQIGWEAWPVLQELVLAGLSECEYFLGAVVRLGDVSPQTRCTVLLAAARNPDRNVRSRLLELLDEMPNNLRRNVLQELTAPDRPKDSVTDRAWEAWDGQRD